MATHERAGEIVYRHISGLTYEVKIITYTYAPSPADRPELEIKWGDGTSSVLPRTYKQDLTPVIRRNEYVGQHTYPSSAGGIFTISVEDPNRNYGIINIPNSVNIPFYIETELVINPFLGANNSVQLLNPPLDYGCVDRLYIHNPGAYDPDGDSISYKLTVCRGANGQPIPGYTYPSASSAFYIDELTGDLVWDMPELQGEYNVAFIIEEWRSGIRLGYVTRDLQIQIGACSNYPPVITVPPDTCVEAGNSLSVSFSASDPNGHSVVMTSSGSPFLQQVSPAVMVPDPAIGEGEVSATLNWNTVCAHVRKNPHVVFVKARDTLHEEIPLTSYKSFSIKVIAPAPEILSVLPVGNSIRLEWSRSICEQASGYYLYRRDGPLGYEPDYCVTGVPPYTGFKKIATLASVNDTSFVDDNEGAGLVHGISYCYMVTAFFADGAESYPSEEWCAALKKDLPVITHVSVEATAQDTGKIFVGWSKPVELDTVALPPPYRYVIEQRDSENGAQISEVSFHSGLNDTMAVITGLNTSDVQYFYRISLYHGSGAGELIGSSVWAPSVFLIPQGSDKSVILNWNSNQPWINDQFTIYRKNPVSGLFDSIGTADEPFWTDTGLVNGVNYCYRIKSSGRYSAGGFVDPIINFSQEACARPVDNVPPCPPVLQVETECDLQQNLLSWSYPDTCDIEELNFYIYYSAGEGGDYILYDSTRMMEYLFRTEPPVVVGCFAVTALDSLYNQSEFGNIVCVGFGTCGQIWFPNVITPNGDQLNDWFQADSVNSVLSLELKLFNRWGQVVYETDDPFFMWDGTDQNNGQPCSPGTYFFEAVVSERMLTGPRKRTIRGSVTLLRE
ncbi:MAG: hypothetical protein Kow00127_15340 [Bacteroidales bacterium]